MKRRRGSVRNGERKAMESLTDRLSDLPDSVLLHIMKFMNVNDAAQTSLLSKRWKPLWKRLTSLTLHTDYGKHHYFNKFLSSFLSVRDDSISMHNLDLMLKGCIGPKLLNRVMTYAASHDVQQMIISVGLSIKKPFELPSCVFSCRSLTVLKLSFGFQFSSGDKIKLPKSFELPSLESLHVDDVTFATGDNGCVDPFSTCNMLNTLVVQNCYLHSDAKVLCISNSNLSSLTIISNSVSAQTYEITLSTPNLNLLTIEGYSHHQLSSTCNIACLEKVDIRCYEELLYDSFLIDSLVLISWLRVLANVKIMTLSRNTFEILNDLLSHDSTRTQLPCFVRLKSLRLERKSFLNISDEVVSRMVEYLLQNSPLNRVDIIKC